ncbi:MAG: polysaccharide deacetylase family protein [Candidatus Omnitrophica bacterium]|nr:polysaccharide deacetylase family protein [Candidatus Omnitrophota bacterium]
MSRFAYHLPILKYHCVGPAPAPHVPTVSAAAFERQMSWLARWRYRILTFDELLEAMEGGRRVPRHSTILTFDDGYEGVYTAAWPILKRFGFPAVIFVTPAEVGTRGFASWEQLNQMAGNGFTIGSHTMHHAYLPDTPQTQLHEELAGSKAVIEQRLGRRVDYLGYPIGGYTPSAQAAARAAGYRAACTTNRGTSFALADRYAIRRVKITERDANPLTLWAKLSGYYDAFRALAPPG